MPAAKDPKPGDAVEEAEAPAEEKPPVVVTVNSAARVLFDGQIVDVAKDQTVDGPLARYLLDTGADVTAS